jgi:spermidine/putrescine transport system substrate-binding protein
MSDHPVRILASHQASTIIRREVSRRKFLMFTAAAASTAALAACAPADPQAGGAPAATGGPLEGNLSIYTWGDYDDPAVLEAFSAELGPQITLDSYGSNEEMIAKLIAARGTSGYDIVIPTGVFIPQMVENGLLEELNLDLIPNIQFMDPAYLAQDWDPQNRHSVCKAWGTTGFVYDTTVITRDLQTWEDFFDAAQNEASGRTTVLDDPKEITGMYFWANGIDWNTTDSADLDAAEAYLTQTFAPHISAFDSFPGGSAIPTGSQVLMQSWNGDARLGIINSPDPDRWAWRLGGPTTQLWMDNWAIAEGAPNIEAAHAFINFTMIPENQLLQLDYIGYNTGAANINAAAQAAGLPLLDLVFFTPEQTETMKNGALNDAQGRIVEIWNAMKAAAGA